MTYPLCHAGREGREGGLQPSSTPLYTPRGTPLNQSGGMRKNLKNHTRLKKD
jgi:hypothetical protein